MPMTPKKAVLYIRVSTTDQAEHGASLDNQERACYDWVYRNGMQVLKLFRDEGKSAKTLNRPAMQEMLAYIAEHGSEIDYLVVYQMDRLSRSFVDFADLLKILARHKIELRDSASNVVASESDELIQGVQALLAQHDNRLKSKRVSENMRRHASQGYRMHKAPFGLRNVRDVLGRPTVEPVQPQADQITHLLTIHAQGLLNKGQLLHEARRMGLTQANGRPMSYQFIDKMLRQPLYAGLEKSTLTDGQFIQSAFESIIPQWVYYTNQELLDGRKSTKTDGYMNVHPDYPLRKFVMCEDCRKPLRGSASTGRGGKKYPRYHCSTPGCKSRYIKPDELHEQFLDLLTRLSPDNGRLNLLKTLIVRVWRDEVKTMRERKNKLNSEIDKLSEQKLDAAEKVITGELTASEKTALTKRLTLKIGTAKTELRKIEGRIGTKEDAVEYALSYLGNAPRLWNSASPEMKQVYQRMIFPEGLPYNLSTNQFGTAKMSNLYTLAGTKKDPSMSDESLLVTPAGFEPAIAGLRTRSPGPLDEGAIHTMRPRRKVIPCSLSSKI